MMSAISLVGCTWSVSKVSKNKSRNLSLTLESKVRILLINDI